MDFLRSFDLTPRNIKQTLLNHYKSKLNYLSSIPESVHPITINLIKDNVALLESKLNKNIRESQITYYTDEEK